MIIVKRVNLNVIVTTVVNIKTVLISKCLYFIGIEGVHSSSLSLSLSLSLPL